MSKAVSAHAKRGTKYRRKHDPFTPRDRWVDFEGQRIKVYSIGYLAHMTQRTTKRLRDWMKLKVLPKPIIDFGDHFTWWTAAELIGYTTIVRQGQIRPQFRSLFGIQQQMFDYRRMLKRLYVTRPHKIRKDLGTDVDWRTVLYRKQEKHFQKEAEKLLRMIPPRQQTDVDDPEKVRAIQLKRAREMLAARGLQLKSEPGVKKKRPKLPDDMQRTDKPVEKYRGD